MLTDFHLKESHSTGESSIFVGEINGKCAILIVPMLRLGFEDIFNKPSVSVLVNDVYCVLEASSNVKIQYRLIYPANEHHIIKYTKRQHAIMETYDEYKKSIIKNPVAWIQNIINNESQEKIYYQDDDFILIRNYKWDTKSTENIQLLLIFKDNNLRTIRDLESNEILLKARDVIKKEIKKFDLSYSDVVVFFHYRPTYNHLHLHIVNINMDGDSTMSVVRARLLEDVIYNLGIKKDYYKGDIFTTYKK